MREKKAIWMPKQLWDNISRIIERNPQLGWKDIHCFVEDKLRGLLAEAVV